MFRKYWAVIIYTLICGVILFLSFQKVFENPSHYLYGRSGDGLKNYYTTTYYVQHDNGFHFSGMNYPYGEHILFTDNQPIYALFFNWIDENVIDLDRHIVGIINIWLIISIFLGGFLLFLILKKYQLPDWYAIIMALLIVFLSPQLPRIGAHYALSYTFYVPIIWYLLMCIFDDKKRWWPYVGLGAMIIITAMTHLYFLAINLLFILGYCFFTFLFLKKAKLKPILITLAVLLITAFGVIRMYSVTDVVEDRPIKPYGTHVYTSSFESAFLPHSGPIDKWLKIGNQQFEGHAYVGLIGLLFLACITFVFFKWLFKNRSKFKIINDNPPLYIPFFTGAVIFLFSAYFFHKIDVFGILESNERLNQFRSIGRFAWVFYYTFTVFMAYHIFHFFEKKRKEGKSIFAFGLLALVILVWSNDAHRHFKDAIGPIFNKNLYLSDSDRSYSNAIKKAGKSIDDFQAIFQLPLVVIGPELFAEEQGQWSMRESTRCANDTGLPIVDIMMSRTSLSQAMDLMQLLGNQPVERQRLQAMDGRPLLLLCEEEHIRADERALIEKANFIAKMDHVTLYELPLDRIKSEKNRLYHQYNLMGIQGDSTFLDGQQGFYYANGFDTTPSDTVFSGIGARWFEDEEIICKEIAADNQLYELSLWMYIDPKSEKQGVIFNDYTNSIETQSQHFALKHMRDTKGYWCRVKFQVDAGMKHCLRVEGKALIDGVLIRPLKSRFIEFRNGKIAYDHCPLN